MKPKILFLYFLIAASFVLGISAQGLPQSSIAAVIGAYRYYREVGEFSINAPTTVEIPFENEFIERFDFAVLDKTANIFEPHFFKQEMLVNETPVSVGVSPYAGAASRMNDNDARTYADFPLPDNAQGRVQVILSGVAPITSSALTVLLADNVALPTSVEIRAVVDGQNKIVVAARGMDRPTVYFPQTTSGKWTIMFTFSQPLRISELRLKQDNAAKSSVRAIRFLAQPAHSYRVYFDPDRSAAAPLGEAGDLASAQDVLILPAATSQNNPDYIIADVDGDGTPDIRDNCVSLNNPDQQDVNNNGRGDACDDFDQDGLINSKDNCPDNPNKNQKDIDSDGAGDVCDKEESRITERHAWVPWVGIGFAALVLISLFVLTAKSTKKTL